MMPYDQNLKDRSRELRNNMTSAEVLLWTNVRKHQLQGYRFNRQKILGDYIVDFYCSKAKLVIEVDGGQHNSGEMVNSDKIRDDFLDSLGLKVLRFSNAMVLNNVNKVMDIILENVRRKVT